MPLYMFLFVVYLFVLTPFTARACKNSRLKSACIHACKQWICLRTMHHRNVHYYHYSLLQHHPYHPPPLAPPTKAKNMRKKTHPICGNMGGMLKGGISWAAESSGPALWGGCIICPSWGPSLMPPMAAEGWGCMPTWEGPATPGGSW